MESMIKIKATPKEMELKFDDSNNKYYYIKFYDGHFSYNGDDNEAIIFYTLLRHNEEIGSLERPQVYTFDSLEKEIEKRVSEKKIKKEQIIEIISQCNGHIVPTIEEIEKYTGDKQYGKCFYTVSELRSELSKIIEAKLDKNEEKVMQGAINFFVDMADLYKNDYIFTTDLINYVYIFDTDQIIKCTLEYFGL